MATVATATIRYW